MPLSLVDVSELGSSAFDEIIDVRSPSEFADDHLAGAINLPVLNDEQRETVGTIYKQVSAFEARKLGASLVSANIAQHLKVHLAARPPNYQPLVYCWRGGQRSNSFALVLEQVGWHVSLLSGGYKAYRNQVIEDLLHLPGRFEFRVLSGLTGSGKTDILKELAKCGEQVLDLEGLANHQGSLLGEPPGGQNVSQKKFETRLRDALSVMSTERPVWVEAESAKIGKVFCPKAMLEMIRSSMRIEIMASIEERVHYLNARYSHWQDDPSALLSKLGWLRKRHGDSEIERWREMATEGHWDDFVKRILEVHYDPSYQTAGTETAPPVAYHVEVGDLLGTGSASAARALLALADGLKS